MNSSLKSVKNKLKVLSRSKTEGVKEMSCSQHSSLFLTRFSDYTKLVEVYFNFAFYTCCVPYRFKKEKCGRYILHTWWPQRIASYTTSLLYIYVITFRFADRFKFLLEETQKDQDNPWLYLRFLEAAAYVNYAIILFYIQSFRGERLLNFWNEVQAYSQKYHPHRGYLSTKRLFLGSSFFVNLVATFITLVGFLNFFIYNRGVSLNFKAILVDARFLFLWQDYDDDDECGSSQNSLMNNCQLNLVNQLLVVTRLMVEALRNMRDMYTELFFIVGIVSMWIISADFKSLVMEEVLLTTKGRSFEILSFKLYQDICRLSRSFNKAYGAGLLSYFLLNVTYYPISLDKLFLPVQIGAKIYCLEYICTAATIYGLAAHFTRQMTSLKKLMDLGAVSKLISKRQLILVMHLNDNNFHTIRARFFPITFHTVTEFVKQVMVILLICVESKIKPTSVPHKSISEYGTGLGNQA